MGEQWPSVSRHRKDSYCRRQVQVRRRWAADGNLTHMGRGGPVATWERHEVRISDPQGRGAVGRDGGRVSAGATWERHEVRISDRSGTGGGRGSVRGWRPLYALGDGGRLAVVVAVCPQGRHGSGTKCELATPRERVAAGAACAAGDLSTRSWTAGGGWGRRARLATSLRARGRLAAAGGKKLTKKKEKKRGGGAAALPAIGGDYLQGRYPQFTCKDKAFARIYQTFSDFLRLLLLSSVVASFLLNAFFCSSVSPSMRFFVATSTFFIRYTSMLYNIVREFAVCKKIRLAVVKVFLRLRLARAGAVFGRRRRQSVNFSKKALSVGRAFLGLLLGSSVVVGPSGCRP